MRRRLQAMTYLIWYAGTVADELCKQLPCGIFVHVVIEVVTSLVQAIQRVRYP
jgi:hypothetical protein